MTDAAKNWRAAPIAQAIREGLGDNSYHVIGRLAKSTTVDPDSPDRDILAWLRAYKGARLTHTSDEAAALADADYWGEYDADV